MIFYCPNCRDEVDVEPTGKIVTKSGRVAHKAACPVCGQDMAEFIPGEHEEPPVAPASQPGVGVPQPSEAAAVGVPQPSVQAAEG